MGIARLGGWKGYSSERKRGRHHFLCRLTQTNCNHARMIIIQKCVQTAASTAAFKRRISKIIHPPFGILLQSYGKHHALLLSV